MLSAAAYPTTVGHWDGWDTLLTSVLSKLSCAQDASDNVLFSNLLFSLKKPLKTSHDVFK